MIKFTFLTENKTYRKGFLAEAGLSVYIKTDTNDILFDMGVSDICFENAKLKKLNAADVDFAVISHGHYDHTGGIPRFCKMNENASIYIHREAFRESYAVHNGKIAENPCSILVPEEQLKALKKRFIYTDKAVQINEDIIISGTIPPAKGFSPSDKFMVKKKNKYIEDDMVHEQFLVIRNRDEKGKSAGLYIFSGCSHKGIKPALEYARVLFPNDEIKGVIAGLHLCNADEDETNLLIEELKNENIELLVPVHCTGIAAIAALKAAFGSKCMIANTGDTITIE